MSNVRNAVISALDEIGIPHQDGPDNSLVFVLNHVDAEENISFFVSFVPDDDSFVTMGAHIWECGQEAYTLLMAIAGNVNATAKVAKIFPLHMPVSEDDDCGCGCHETEADDCGCGCGCTEEKYPDDTSDCGCGCGGDDCADDDGTDDGCGCGCGDDDCGDGNVRAHFFVTSQFFWTEDTMPKGVLTKYINAALAARQDFVESMKEFPGLAD